MFNDDADLDIALTFNGIIDNIKAEYTAALNRVQVARDNVAFAVSEQTDSVYMREAARTQAHKLYLHHLIDAKEALRQLNSKSFTLKTLLNYGDWEHTARLTTRARLNTVAVLEGKMSLANARRWSEKKLILLNKLYASAYSSQGLGFAYANKLHAIGYAIAELEIAYNKAVNGYHYHSAMGNKHQSERDKAKGYTVTGYGGTLQKLQELKDTTNIRVMKNRIGVKHKTAGAGGCLEKTKEYSKAASEKAQAEAIKSGVQTEVIPEVLNKVTRKCGKTIVIPKDGDRFMSESTMRGTVYDIPTVAVSRLLG